MVVAQFQPQADLPLAEVRANHMKKGFYVYFLRSLRNDKVYTGFSQRHPEVRLKEHLNGTNKWSRKNGPFKLIYFEKYHCKQDAMQREKFFKSGFGRKIRDAIISTLN